MSRISQPLQCSSQLEALGDKFIWYAPHSGFSNQLSEFKNAILMAAILNRTLVIPPVLDHHAVALGSCPKFRVLSPKDLRLSVLGKAAKFAQIRYISMADIVDLSELVSTSAIRVIDFRVFVSMWCGMEIDCAYSEDSEKELSMFENLRQCGSLLSGNNGNWNKCLYSVDEDCRTTVWTYQKNEDGVLDSFQPDEQLKNKKNLSFVRRRQDIYKSLGPGSGAESATVLAFGSLFTAPYKGSESYIDIHDAPRDPHIEYLFKKIEFLPFVPEIMSAGKEFALETVKAPFLCAQLRLLDGQFKNHWEATFLRLKQQLESLKQTGLHPVHIFVMTDLPIGNWTRSYLGNLVRDSNAFKLFVLREEDELVKRTAKKLVAAGYGLKFGFVPEGFDGIGKHCHPPLLPDILLYIEEAVCSCASLGFVGTAGSTIAESIELMRKNAACLFKSALAAEKTPAV
ncbi:unnamed protein product [Ilex paraguariensis]|uniref:O-fucosyltransferase family protein n=1 Tax=Ilex paraguariensis TaxID=185542 RepID=A0ABC8R900_9AQUA